MGPSWTALVESLKREHRTRQTIYHSIIKFSLMAFSDFVRGEIFHVQWLRPAGLEIEEFKMPIHCRAVVA